MTSIDITEKELDILVNGNQQASYSQRSNSGDYDISINPRNSFQLGSEYFNEIVQDTFPENEYVQLHTISQDGWYRLRMANVNAYGGENWQLRINGDPDFDLVLDGFEAPKEKMKTLNSGDTIGYYMYEQSNGIEVDVDRVTNSTSISGPAGNSYRVPTGITIDGVTQS